MYFLVIQKLTSAYQILNGKCIDQENRWECECEPGWAGDNCDDSEYLNVIISKLYLVYWGENQ